VDYRWDDERAAQIAADAKQAEPTELALLVYLSNLIGQDGSLTQPGGGNSSLKQRELDFAGRSVDVLRVKGSGTDLRTIGARGFTGLRRADLDHLRARRNMSDEEMMAFMRACMTDGAEPAPSVETPLHSVLPARFIVHTHDFATQALTDTPRPAALVREALGDDAAYVDYVRPGFPLARAVIDLGPVADNARGLVLGRHGLIAWGDSAKECYENLHGLINLALRFIDQRRAAHASAPGATIKVAAAPPERRRALARTILPALRGRLSRERPVILHYDDSPEALDFVGAVRAGEFAARGMSTPEHILRCGRLPLFVDADLPALSAEQANAAIAGALDGFAARYRETFARSGPTPPVTMLEPVPRVVLLPGLGLITAMKDKANAVVGNLCYRHVMRVADAAESLGGFRFLDDADGIEFEYWPLELAKLKQGERELSRRVALITGAASGIGRAIAERFAAEGAHLVLTDIAAGPLRETTEAIARACKDPHRVIAVEADATRADQTEAAFDQAVLAFGGVDILVCNAGFIQAGALDQTSEETWDRHFDLNVKGYFLAARAAIRAMKLGHGGAIVFNASKGAFAPTADNAAYASSKAAVAALARNLAVELGPFGIRVNCFNADFVETPLMRALIAQRAAQRGVTPEQQIGEYRRRNAMGVGPIPAAAVAEAALFLASPRAQFTTGAALPIDGGIKEAMPR
jgi:rhamnulose-1-phosphate aldolase/alcohol dehydrogenase